MTLDRGTGCMSNLAALTMVPRIALVALATAIPVVGADAQDTTAYTIPDSARHLRLPVDPATFVR